MPTYAYDQEWQDERERLAGMERLWDGGTFALLERLGVGVGSRVAEVGAGGGSVVEWLADRVGPEGCVLAADVSMKFLEPLAGPVVQVSEHDIRAAPLPAGEYDVVHARLLVEHVGTGALANMLAGVDAGGWLLIEDYDMGCRGWHPDEPAGDRVLDAVLDVMASMGFDGACGRKLPLELEALGLEEVRCEGRAHVIRGGSPETAFSDLSIRALREVIVSSGRATDDEVETVLERIADPQRTWLSPLLVACWGRHAR